MVNRVQKNINLTLVGFLTSKLGTFIYNFAISLYVLKITKSAMLFSITLVVNMLPQVIISPIAGTFADRFQKKRIIVISDLLSGLTMLILYTYAHNFGLSMIAIYIASFFLSSLNAIFSTTFSAAIPEIVDKVHLVRLNALKGMADSGARIAGPIFGGIIYVYADIQLFILVNAFSFILSGLSETLITFEVKSRAEEETTGEDLEGKTSFLSDFNEGIHFIRGNHFIKNLMLNIMFINVFGAVFSVAFPFAMVNDMKFSNSAVGFANASVAVGMLLTSLLMAKHSQFQKPLRVTAFGIAIIGCSFLGMGFLNGLANQGVLWVEVAVAVCGFILGLGQIVTNIPLEYILQTRIPLEFLGRLSGIIGSMSIAIYPLSAVATGFLIQKIGTMPLLILSGIVIIIMSLKLLLDKSLKADNIVTEV